MHRRLRVHSLGRVLRKARKTFLVRGRDSFEVSGGGALLTPMLGSSETAVWVVESADPDFDEIEALASRIHSEEPDVCVSIGGGRVIDSAKAATFLARQRHSLAEFLEDDCLSAEPRQGELVAIPTTSGTGSEATHFSVVHLGPHKRSLARTEVIPEFYYLDPDLTASLPLAQVASTGLDALCQAIESLWSLSATTESRFYARRSLRLSTRHLRSAVFAPTRRARAAMLLAAHYSGRAINVTKTTAPHALSYGIRKATGLAHGFSVCLTFPEILQATISGLADRRCHADVSWLRLLREDGQSRAATFLDELRRDLLPLAGLPPLGSEIEKMTREIVTGVNRERLLNHPIPLSEDELAVAVSAGLRSISENVGSHEIDHSRKARE